jgi:hypothetical protein
MNQRSVLQFLAMAVLLVVVCGSAWAQAAGLHLIFNINDDQDLYPSDAGRSMGAALDRVKPEQIESNAEWYFVLLEAGSSIDSLSLPVKGKTAHIDSEDSMESVSEMAADSAQAITEDQGDSGWIELEAYSASVYYWSETGEGESNWQSGNFRIFIRRLASGDIVVATGPGPVPPGS